mgnify:CR=1 FL=1
MNFTPRSMDTRPETSFNLPIHNPAGLSASREGSSEEEVLLAKDLVALAMPGFASLEASNASSTSELPKLEWWWPIEVCLQLYTNVALTLSLPIWAVQRVPPD